MVLTTIANIFRKKIDNQEQTLEDLLAKINPQKLPCHVAIIMDGNGRWAQRKGLLRVLGHRAGVESLRDVVKLASSLGIKFLTVYAFSTENWKRPQEEVNILMDLLVEYLQKEIRELHVQNVRIKAIGKIQELPLPAQREIKQAENLTRENSGLQLNLALNYGGRDEILTAIKNIVHEVQESNLNIDNLTIENFSNYLYTSDIPDPDLLIRPSGELRISNFLLWQLAYTEFWLTDIYWPDFRKIHLAQALLDFQNRERRYGGLSK